MSKKLKYKIIALMKEKNFSAMDVATKCQVHVQSVYNWGNIEINDDSSIPADKLRVMANIFKVSMEDMYTTKELITA
jgi:transcriptional regulator with XRE-family HTH domain